MWNQDSSQSLDIPCDDAPLADVWCPFGAASDPIPFARSNATLSPDEVSGGDVSNPVNYATAFLDLDWLYGRDEETAATFRTMEGGFMNLTDDGLPHLLPGGTWQVSRISCRRRVCSLKRIGARSSTMVVVFEDKEKQVF